MATQVIIIGGGLAGLSAAHTVLQNGGRTVLIERNAFCGGNSTKATSGICGTVTEGQINKGINDSVAQFQKDIALSGSQDKKNPVLTPLMKILANESGPAIDWLCASFGLDLSIVAFMGGHTNQRCHRGNTKQFPGMMITYGQMEKYETICEKQPDKARLLSKSKVIKLLTENGKVIGVTYVKNGKEFNEYGPVIIASGGYGADFTDDSLLKKYRPDLMHYSTTNGAHCDGSGTRMAVAIGADVADMDRVQVHPTGVVHPKEPNAKVKFLAAEAMRGEGGIILDRNGKRLVDELQTRDYVSNVLTKSNQGPYRLVLGGKATSAIAWHCKHYVERGQMKKLEGGQALANEIGCSVDTIGATFADYMKAASGQKKDDFGKTKFMNADYKVDDVFHTIVITPVIHYTMGGIKIDTNSAVVGTNGQPIPGLYATGEVCGGVHGYNRLGGCSLLDCVVFGRVSGRNVSGYLLNETLTNLKQVQAGGSVQGYSASSSGSSGSSSSGSSGSSSGGSNSFTPAQVAEHNKEDDCWVIIGDQVFDVTNFLDDHPGGKHSIVPFAGKDATEAFDMLHDRSVLTKYAAEYLKGTVSKGPGAKL